MEQNDVIKAFAGHIRPGLTIDRWPDEENRTTEDIDALAGEFAIEHTSIDVNDGMREKNDWFMKAAGDLETELNPAMSFRLRVNFDYGSIQKGQNWKNIKGAIREWVLKEAPLLPEGFQIIHTTGVPFEMRVEKVSNELPALVFSRSFEKDQETLESSIEPLINRKARKIVPYIEAGKTGIILIQSEDIAFMNRARLAKAIAGAFPKGLPYGIHQVWYADTTIPEALEFHDVTP